jgi:hypothetical protein
MTKTASQLEAEIAQALRAPERSHTTPWQTDQGFSKFDSWSDVLAAARRGDRLWYWAPMDRSPVSIRVVKVFKNGGLRIDPMSNQASNFTADKGHLDRFRRKG